MEKGPTTSEFEQINIGNMQSPKMINVKKCCTCEEKEVARNIFVEYQNVFIWSYKDLKSFRGEKIKHQIPLKPNTASFRQKKRNYSPKVADTIFWEVNKMLKVRIIYPIHHST